MFWKSYALDAFAETAEGVAMNEEKSWYETKEGKEALLKELNRRFKFNKDGTIENRENIDIDVSIEILPNA